MKIVFKHTDAHPALVTALYANVKSMHKNMPSVELSKVNIYSTAQVKEPKNSLFRISAFRELAKNTRNQTE